MAFQDYVCIMQRHHFNLFTRQLTSYYSNHQPCDNHCFKIQMMLTSFMYLIVPFFIQKKVLQLKKGNFQIKTPRKHTNTLQKHAYIILTPLNPTFIK